MSAASGRRVAALYDVHGNLPALEAALAAARGAGADLLVFGGDLAWGPLPAETVAAIRALDDLPVLHVRGNADREVAFGQADDAVTRWAAARLGAAARAWLGGLPHAQVVAVEGLGAVRFCHGSPRSDAEALTAATPEARAAEALTHVDEPVVVCGHTHAQFDRDVAGRRLVNPGSVGLPFGAPGAHWALLHAGGADLLVTPYDTAAAGAAFRAAGGPEAEDFARHAAGPPPAALAAELHG